MQYPTLRVTTPDGQVREYPLDTSPVVIGRAESSRVVIDHVSVSRRHARIVLDGDQVTLEDLGSAIGISVTTFMLTRGTQTTHADIAAGITPFKRVLQGGGQMAHILDPATRHGAAMLDQMVTYQAKIIAFNNDFRLMALTVIPPLILLLFMRRAAKPA